MKKTLSIILAVLMIATTIPFAFAAETPIAKIGDVEYTDFDEALANWVDGTTLVLLADTPEYAEDIEIKDKAVILDLNGHTLQLSTTQLSRFMLLENGDLTIRDNIGTGKVHSCHTPAYINKGALTIESGTLIGGIFNWSGILTMTGGKVVGYSSLYDYTNQATHGDGTFNFYGGTLKGRYGVWDMEGAVVNFSGAIVVEATDNICSGQGTTTITGGTFSHAPTSYVAEGCDITENDNGTWTVVCKHSFTNYVETTAPTCTETGIATAKCDIGCIATDEKEIPALEHDIIIDEAVAPTCTETGLTAGQHCSRCDDETVAQEVVPALNHKDTLVQVEAKAKTCTEIGWEAYEYCTACDYSTYEEIPASHEIKTVNKKDATCTEAGHEAYEYCTECDYTTYEEIPSNGHTPLEAVKENEVASKCGVAGSYDLVVYCDVCGEELDRDTTTVDALTHTDADGDYKCDYGCGTQISDGGDGGTGESETPDDPADDVCEDCGKVHTNFFSEIICFFTRIINFIKKLFT